MDRTLIYTAVVMVFVFLVFRHKLMPMLAARKLKEKQQTENPAAAPSAAYPYPFPAFIQTAQGSQPERRDMYFDYRIIPAALHTASSEDSALTIETVDTETNQMLTDLRRRGIVPSELSIVRITDEHIMVYTTYVL